MPDNLDTQRLDKLERIEKRVRGNNWFLIKQAPDPPEAA